MARVSLAAYFDALARATARAAGRPGAAVLAVAVVILWAALGSVFHWSDTWQLVINTGTTIVTFLMVFLIQNTQNCDTHALHIKLDELIRVSSMASNALLDLEALSEGELKEMRQRYRRLAQKGRNSNARSPSAPSGVAT